LYSNGDHHDSFHSVSIGDRILEAMIALARCSKQQQIVVAGSKSIELASELNQRGFIHVASAANCGRAAEQYDVALVDWRRRTFQALETALDWLVDFLKPGGVVVVWIDPQKQAVRQGLYAGLEGRGFLIEDRAVHEFGCAVLARRREEKPIPRAA
jgi:hypothetical protein